MWHLEKPSKKVLDEYINKLLPKLKERIFNQLPSQISSILLPTRADGTLDDDNLKKLLINEPDDLFVLSENLMVRIIEGYNVAELPDVAKAKKAKKETEDQKQLLEKYELLKTLEDAFDYTGALGSKKSRAYKLTAAAKHNTCVYCNRQYTFNIVRDGGTNDYNRIARPALDHWFPKSLFPLMSLSYFNLIPSCTVCNSAAKLDGVWMLDSHIHPYMTADDEPQFKFRYKAGPNATWDIDFDNLSGIELNTVNDLCLREAYQAHCSLEVADLIDLATKNNGTYMKQLYSNILSLYSGGTDKAKAYRLLLGTEMHPFEYKNRPLSKLKRDIVEQIEKAQGLKIFEG